MHLFRILEVIILSDIDDLAFEVEFMTCVIDKTDNLKVTDSDSHFSDFVGVHPSKIKQGKLFLHDLLKPKDRETVMRQICKKNARYVYLDFYIKNENDEYVFVHCTGQNIDDSPCCRLTMADVSRSVEKSEQLKERAREMNHLIDLVTGGVCLFKVYQNMHIEALYMNESCCRFFGTTKDSYSSSTHRLDELIYPQDKSLVFQAIGNSMATKKPIDLEIRVIDHKDHYIWCKLNAAIQRYDKDNCPVFHAILTDITKVKESEESADRQSDMMVKMFKNLPGPIFCADLNEPFILDVVSSDFMKLIGYTRAEFFEEYSGDLSNFISDREVAAATHAIKSQAKNSKVVKTTYSLKTKGGKHIVVVDRRKIVEQDNSVQSTIGMLRDVTSKHLHEDIDF